MGLLTTWRTCMSSLTIQNLQSSYKRLLTPELFWQSTAETKNFQQPKHYKKFEHKRFDFRYISPLCRIHNTIIIMLKKVSSC